MRLKCVLNNNIKSGLRTQKLKFKNHKPRNTNTNLATDQSNQTQKQQTETHILFLTSLSLFFTHWHSQLSLDYYKQKCPAFEQTIWDTITNKQITSPTIAAATLHLLFHDCLTNSCDASILISSTPFNFAERDADINLSLPGDAFDVIAHAKIALELTCPNTVSCVDILVVVTCDLSM